ncbi:MAG TPA: CRISPR-associated endonuclease Cas2 [Chlorobaculum sp.]|uniref:CRISPR-associated endoribonuclease Cas2 n=1 Tax=Chlorobaculum tepidum (strain ATCC 49652 / DSM 12025 / NBRC 103806 / TLS) TaxID=194439 RepID=CAS2_CHLTE|nr:CRISPR-associated endonuclease Cas2 [Chlorobaculum tepidum]Q8KDC5.1 RecName: Full=CRISPR-associated endoribonuclease Cas2 [Chlorobaculum tepidum TLS]AAM72362.1 CRISPR-associated protein Cas2 [Chlorobaculum tepidum TLS]HBU23998.1 CRISPR-associated endonuclease Cas2 [Chlorobaculum sp.]
MLVLVTYDVNTETPAGRRRLRRIAKTCQNYGQRVQFSVFECNVDPAQWVKLRSKLLNEMDPKLDSLRFYFLGSNWQGRVEHEGAKEPRDLEGTLIL